MKGFLEQYGVGIFVLVLTSILIAFASPIGKTIKNDITKKVNNIEEITDDEIEIAKGNYYTIVFDGNGATSGSMEPIKVICGKELKLPIPTFTKHGDTPLNIWRRGNNIHYYSCNDTIKDLAKRNETITLYAIWDKYLDVNGVIDGVYIKNINNYGTFDYYYNGKLYYSNQSDVWFSVKTNDTFEIKNIKAKKGYTYIGVCMIPKSTTNLSKYEICGLSGIISNKSVIINLAFITNTYTITYHANATDATGTTASSHHTYDKSASLTQNGFTRLGYTFLGWNTAADGSGTTYTDMQEVKNLTDQNNVNIDLYAMWQKN